ncbi:mitochondrial carrier domain-containing protein, partial [Phascolomyces articulosus]
MEEDYDYESLGNNTSMGQNALAGAFAGVAEHCAMYPTRMQVIQIVNNPSFKTASRNLWRGVNSVVLGAGPAHALHFATYEYCKETFVGNEGHSTIGFAAAGACATLAHDGLMNPFDGK